MIFDKVDELCELIEGTKQYSDYLEAEVNLENDGEGIDMLTEFYDIQDQYVQAFTAGPQESVEDLETLLQDTHKKIMEYPATGDYIRSRQAFEELMDEVNNRILQNLGLLVPDMDDSGCSSCDEFGGCEGC